MKITQVRVTRHTPDGRAVAYRLGMNQTLPLLEAEAADLAAVDVPVLVIVGEHELLYNADKAIERAAVMPRARVEIVEDAGHAALYDRPDVVNALTLDFIDEND